MSYKNMRADTIAQRRILLWLDKAFNPGAVTVKFTSECTAELTDKTGCKGQVVCKPRADVSSDTEKEVHTRWIG